MTFTIEGLKELKHCVNSMISSRYAYLYSDISDEEKEFTKRKISENYDILSTILKMISEEKSK